MKKYMILLLATILSNVSYAAGGTDVGSSTASTQKLSCLPVVYKAENLLTESKQKNALKPVELKFENDGIDTTETINGEKVEFYMFKQYDKYDIYSMDVVIRGLDENGKEVKTILSNSLINQGNVPDNGFMVNYKKDSELYEFMQTGAGGMVVSKKFREALKQQALNDPTLKANPELLLKRATENSAWSGLLPIQKSSDLVEVTKKLVNEKYLKPTDLVALGIVFNCLMNK